MDDDVITLSDDEVYEIENIEGVKLRRGKLLYKIRWLNTETSWEPEDNFVGEGSVKVLEDFKAENKEKIEHCYKREEERRERKRQEREKQLEMDESLQEEVDLDEFAPRELTEEDSFYGKPVKELQGESRRLFDPSHKQTTTDLILAQFAGGEGRISRSQAAKLKMEASEGGSGGERSRSDTPLIPKVTPRKRTRKPKKDVSPEDDEDEDDEVEEKKSAPKRATTANNGKGKGRKTGPARKIEVAKKGEEMEQVEIKKEQQTRKRIAEPRLSETPPPVEEKSKFFNGRNDDSDEENTWAKKVPSSDTSITESLTRAFERMKCRNSNLIDAILKEDVVSARLLLKKMDIEVARKLVITYRDETTKYPILQKLIHEGKPKPKELQKRIAIIRFIISFCQGVLYSKNDIDGNLPIHSAIKEKMPELTQLFANCGSPISPINKNRLSPLEMAIQQRDQKSFECLLLKGATYHHLLTPMSKSQSRQILVHNSQMLEYMQTHNNNLHNAIIKMRRMMYKRNLRDVQMPQQPIMIFPRRDFDSIEMSFEFVSSNMDPLHNGFLLVMFPIVWSELRESWIAGTITLKLCAAPELNGRPLKPAHETATPFIFHALPRNGKNVVKMRMHPNDQGHERSTAAVAVQLSKYDRRPVTDTRNNKMQKNNNKANY